MTKFSIIIPVYNAEKYLDRCLKSCINQTYKNIEIICVNDGSTDNSQEILKSYAEKDSRIKIINQNNSGLPITRNNGMKVADGDYIVFLDSDDWIEENTCEILFKEIQDNKDADIIWYHPKVWETESTFKLPYVSDNIKKSFNLFDDIENVFDSVDMLTCWDKAFRKSTLDKYNIYFRDGVRFEDGIFVIEVFKQNPLIITTNNYLYNYNLTNTTSIVHSDVYKQLLTQKQSFKVLLEVFKDTSDTDRLKNAAMDFFLRVIVGMWEGLYFSKHKEEFFDFINLILSSYNGTAKKYKGIKQKNTYFLLAKFHLSWLYWKVIRPFCKYFIVLPYRKLIYIRRQRNE